MAGIIITLNGDGSGFKKALDSSVAAAKQAAQKISKNDAVSKGYGFDSSHLGDFKRRLALKKQQDADKQENHAENQKAFERLKLSKEEAKAKLAADKSYLTSSTSLEMEKEKALARNYANRTKLSGAARKKMMVDARVEAAAASLWDAHAPGIQTSKGDLKTQRDELAQALRARRAMRSGMGGESGTHGGGIGSGAAQLFHVGRASLDSIASGMSPWRVFMQQAPQALQALTFMGKGALATLARIAMIAGPIAAGLGIIATGAYLVHRYFKNLSLGLDDVARKGGYARTTQTEMNDAFRNSSDSAARYKQWLDEVGRSTATVAEETEQLLKGMREEAAIKMQIAKDRGASGSKIMNMELEALKAERETLLAGIKTADENLKKKESESKLIEKEIESSDAGIMEKKAKDKADKLAVLIEEYKNKTGIDKLEGRKDEEQITTLEQSSGPMGGINYTSKSTTVGEEKKRLAQNEIAVGDGSVGSNGNLASLELQLKAALEDEKKFKAAQTDLAEKLKTKQIEVKQSKDSSKTLGTQLTDVQKQEELKKKYGSKLGNMSGGSGGGSSNLTERERIGAASNTQVTLIDINRRQLEVLKVIAHKQANWSKPFSGNDTVGGVHFA